MKKYSKNFMSLLLSITIIITMVPLSALTSFADVSAHSVTLAGGKNAVLMKDGTAVAGNSETISVSDGGSISSKYSFEGKTNYEITGFSSESSPKLDKVESGDTFTLFLDDSGNVWACGDNNSGQLGIDENSVSETSTPTKLDGVSNIVDISAGSSYAILLDKDGNVWTFGNNSDGELGRETSGYCDSTPTKISGVGKIKDIDAGNSHSVLLDEDGNVWTFGNNYYGELGNTTNVMTTNKNSTPTKVSGVSNIASVFAGSSNTFLVDNNNVWAFGYNGCGELGIDTNETYNDYTSTPTKVTTINNIKSVACGNEFTIFVDNKGYAWACGNNFYGQLGNLNNTGNRVPNYTPVKIDGVSNITSAVCGEMHTVLLDSNGDVFTFGSNEFGQLGYATSGEINSTVTKVSSSSGVVSIASGRSHTAMVNENGVAWACGNNYNGQLGFEENYNTFNANNTPKTVKAKTGDSSTVTSLSDITVNGNMIITPVVESLSVEYIDRTADEKTKAVTTETKTVNADSYTKVTTATTEFTDGWYVVKNSVDLGVNATVSGNAKIIILDGAQLHAVGIDINENCSLTIYGGENETGVLSTDRGGPAYMPGIGGKGALTLVSGSISSYGTWNGGAAIGGYNTKAVKFTMYGGSVLADGRMSAGINTLSSIIYGGSLTVSGGAGFGSAPTIYNMKASSGADGKDCTECSYDNFIKQNYGNKYIELTPCTSHNYTKFVVTNKTISCYCMNCNKENTLNTITLKDTSFDFTNSELMRGIDIEGNDFAEPFTVTYTDDSGYNSTIPPKNAGTYTATLTLDNYDTVSVSGTLTINQIAGTLSNKSYTTDYTYKGGEVVLNAPSIADFNTNTDNGRFTFDWYDSTGKTKLSDPPTEVGTYILRANVGGTSNVTAATTDVTVHIGYLSTIESATLSGEEVTGETNWYSTDVVMTAPSSYTMSIGNEGTWVASKTISSSMEDGVTYKLKDSYGYVTDKLTTNPVMIDKDAPTDIKVQYNSNGFKAFLNKISFGLFFNEDVTVTATATDDGIGVKSYQYVALDEKTTDFSGVTFANSLTVEQNSKKYIYVKATDKAGNFAIAGTDGIVVYTDLDVATTTMTYQKKTGSNIDIPISLNENTLKDVKNGNTVLTKDTDYTVTSSGITLLGTYLESLYADDYTISIDYNPYGVESTEDTFAKTIDLKVQSVSSVDYIERSVNESTKEVTKETKTLKSFTVVTPTTTTFTDGWYVVEDNIDLGTSATVSGDAKIIILDGSKLHARGFTIDRNCSLTVYGEENETGVLSSDTGASAYMPGIGGDGALTLVSGSVQTYGTWNGGAAIGGYNGRAVKFIMYGGSLLADGRLSIGINANSRTIYGGTITASGGTAFGISPNIYNMKASYGTSSTDCTESSYYDFIKRGYKKGYVKLTPCTEHSYTSYTASGKTITSSCVYCNKATDTKTITIKDTSFDYTNSELMRGIDIEGDDFTEPYTITYTDTFGYNSTNPPKNAGTYTATLTLDNFDAVFVSGELKINKITGTLSNNSYTTNYTYKGGEVIVEAPTIADFNTNTDNGTFSFDWYDSTGKTKLSAPPTEVGTYILRANVGGTSNVTSATTDVTVHINYLATTDRASLSGTEVAGESNWYSTDVTVNAPSGYSISFDDEKTWVSSKTLSSTNEDGITYKFKDSYGYVTDKFTTSPIKIDKDAPTDVKVQYNENGFKSFLNKISFGLFFNENVTVTATATDDGIGIKSYQYVALDEKTTDFSGVTFVDSLTVEQNSKKYIYVKATDKAGNFVVAGTDGIVVYTDLGVSSTSVSYQKRSKNNTNVALSLNGNTLKEVKNGNTVLTKDTDYTVTSSGITLLGTYLDTLYTGNYTFSVVYNPYGVESTEESFESTFKLTVTSVAGVDYVERSVNDSTNEVTKETKTLSDFTIVTSSTTTLADGWYVVENDIDLGTTLTVSGDAKLVILDGAKLRASGVTIDKNCKLTVYGEENETGVLISDRGASAYYPGINGDGTFVVSSGSVESYGTWNGGAAIGGYRGAQAVSFVMYGGSVIADGRLSPAINTYSSKIYGGTITASGGAAFVSVPTIYNMKASSGASSTDSEENSYYNFIKQGYNKGYAKLTPCTDHSYTSYAVSDKTISSSCVHCNKAIDTKTLTVSDTNNIHNDLNINKGINIVNNNFDEDYTVTYTNSYSGYNSTTPPNKIGMYTAKLTLDNYPEISVSASLKVGYLETNKRANLSGSTANSSGWYTSNVTITAPEGYLMSVDCEKTWVKSTTISTSETLGFVYQLKNSSNQITDNFIISRIMIDKDAPTGDIVAKESSIKSVLNKITFGLFFKNSVDITISGSDSNSDISKIEYQKVSAESEYNQNGTWVNGSSLSVSASEKFIVYARITDNAGNTTIINSNGVVVYKDSVCNTSSVSYTKKTNKDEDISINFNGNTVKEVKMGNTTLTKDTDYTISEKGISLKASYLDTLTADNYTLTVSYNPCGVEDSTENPTNSTVAISVCLNDNSTITNIRELTGVYTGVAVSPEFDSDSTGEATILYKVKGADDSAYSATAPKNVGDYTVKISVLADENYAAATETANFTISKAKLTVTGADISTKVYDESTSATVAKLTFDGLKNGETLENGVDYNISSSTFSDKNKGESKDVHVVYTFADTDVLKNYEFSDGTVDAKGTISAAKQPNNISEVPTEVLTPITDLKDIELPSGWSLEPNSALVLGGYVNIVAVYYDASNYEEGQVTIKVPGAVSIIKDETDTKYKVGTDSKFTVKCTGELNQLIDVLVDGKSVDSSNFSLKSGSTIVNFNQDYMDSLSSGKHTVTLKYNAGSASSDFKVTNNKSNAKKDNSKSSPETGVKIGFVSVLGSLFIAFALYIVLIKRKNKKA